MNERAQSILERLARLNQFATLFQQELKEVTALVRQELGITVDPVSTSPEDMQKMIEAVEKLQKPEEITFTGVSRNIAIGHLLQEYLHPTMINGGKGKIEPREDKLPQYDNCLFATPMSSIMTWPAGFYRNESTKETQLYLKHKTGPEEIEHYFLIDRLPGTEVVICYFVGQAFPKRLEDMSNDEFLQLIKHLKTCLHQTAVTYGAREFAFISEMVQ